MRSSDERAAGQLGYREYVGNADHMAVYSRYQRKYAATIRESDRVLLDMVRKTAAAIGAGRRLSLLDIGCSTGNLLLHLKNAPGLRLDLAGWDIVPSIIAECRANPDLAGIEFAEMNMIEFGNARRFDIVVANASLMFFDPAEFARAIASIAAVVLPGGCFLAFDLFHPFEQEVAIVETSRRFPHGLKFYFRGYGTVRAALERAGLAEPHFTPFSIPIDLPRPADLSDITSYTVRAVDREGMSFRGTIYQPWCHLRARRPA